MSLNINTQAITAFKHLLGKSQTDVSKGVLNEFEGIGQIITGQNVWIESIDVSPAQAVLDGVAVAVSCNTILDATSNGHALFAVWPLVALAGTDPKTGLAFTYGTGTLVNITAGDRVTGAIPDTFGISYLAQPKNGGNAISIGDQRDWIYQYNSGIFFQEDGSNEGWGGSAYGHPDQIDVYVYIGNTVLDITGGGGSSEWYASVTSIESTPPGSPTTGDRYLIASGPSPAASGDWLGFEDKIAQWSGVAWIYTEPTQGGSVQIDTEPGVYYLYSGTDYPGGQWVRVPSTIVRIGVGTGTDTYLGTVDPPIVDYTNVVFIGVFDNANTGVSTLSINSLGAVPIRKHVGASLVDLDANDIRSGIMYMLVHDGTIFQLYTGDIGDFVPIAGTAAGTPVIGDIEVAPGVKIFTTGSPSNPGVSFELDHIKVENGVVKYDSDRTAEFDAFALITKDYADSIGGATDPENIPVTATFVSTGGSPLADEYTGVGTPTQLMYDSSVIYLVLFDQNNTGAVRLDIDGLGYLEMLKGDETLGLIELDPDDIIASVMYYIVYDGTQLQLFETTPTQLPGTYTNLNPSTVTVGGVVSGTTFNSMLYKDLFDMMFYPYLLPTFTSFSISGQSTTMEVGQSIASGSKTFNWVTSNSAYVSPNTIKIRQYIGVWSWLATGLANDSTEAITFPSSIARTSAGYYLWTIYGTRTNSSTFTKNFTVNWYWRRFYGTSASTTLTEADIEALTGNQLASSRLATYTFAAGDYKYFAFPLTFGEALMFKDSNTNLSIAMAGVTEGYTNGGTNGLYYQVVFVTNAYGIMTTYRLYRTRNILGGTINIIVT